jgi:hypothetical protein
MKFFTATDKYEKAEYINEMHELPTEIYRTNGPIV